MVKLTKLKLAINQKTNRLQEDFRIFSTGRKMRNNENRMISSSNCRDSMTECVDNNPFEVLQRSLMNTLRFDQIHGHKKKHDETKCLFAKEQCDIFTEE